MAETNLDVDYLIVGAGAVGMAFADTLLSETDATMAFIDRRDRAGGHWNDAYPFVRLHQPSAFYGVSSRPLGTGAKDTDGPNAGMYELATGAEVLEHFHAVMEERFLPSGRVTFLPRHEASADGSVRSLDSGATLNFTARKIVDAAHSSMEIPSTHPPKYAVAPGVVCIPPNALPDLVDSYSTFTVIGAGKTGIDTCVWLLQRGVPADRIRWVMPRDPWLLNRECFQPGAEFLGRFVQNLADQTEALAVAGSEREVFARLEAAGSIARIDPTVEPRGYRCAIISHGELEQLRRITNVIRLGHVTRIDESQIALDSGTVPTSPDTVHVDCSANGIPRLPAQPVFSGNRITLQIVRLCQPIFSAALIGHVEAVFDDETEKNRICQPVPAPSAPTDFLVMMRTELQNRATWTSDPRISEWIATNRLDAATKQLRSLTGAETDVVAHLQRYLQHAGPAAQNIERLLSETG